MTHETLDSFARFLDLVPLLVDPAAHGGDPRDAFERWTPMPRGGHFAAMEEPEVLAEDIRAFFRPLRG